MAYIGNKPSELYHKQDKQSFNPDGSTVSFSLNTSVVNENAIELFINNVRQEPGSGKAYTASGGTLTMSEAPVSGDEMYCIYQGQAVGHHFIPETTVTGSHIHTTFDLSSKTVTLPSTTLGLAYSHGTATGDGSTVAFTITAGRAVADVLVHVNGVCLVPTDDYTISGTTLTFATAPASGAEIQFRYLPK